MWQSYLNARNPARAKETERGGKGRRKRKRKRRSMGYEK